MCELLACVAGHLASRWRSRQSQQSTAANDDQMPHVDQPLGLMVTLENRSMRVVELEFEVLRESVSVFFYRLEAAV